MKTRKLRKQRIQHFTQPVNCCKMIDIFLISVFFSFAGGYLWRLANEDKGVIPGWKNDETAETNASQILRIGQCYKCLEPLYK